MVPWFLTTYPSVLGPDPPSGGCESVARKSPMKTHGHQVLMYEERGAGLVIQMGDFTQVTSEFSRGPNNSIYLGKLERPQPRSPQMVV